MADQTALSTTTDAVRGEVEASLREVGGLLRRYQNETPAGHSPHMICHKADAALERMDAILATLHPSPEAPIEGQDVEAVARIIVDALIENCTKSDGTCYAVADLTAAEVDGEFNPSFIATRLIAALRAPIERKGESEKLCAAIDAIESPYDEHSQAPEHCAFCNGLEAAATAIRNAAGEKA